MVYLFPTSLIPGRTPQATDQIVTYRGAGKKPGLVNLSDLNFGNSQAPEITASQVIGLTGFIQNTEIPAVNVTGLLTAIQSTGLIWLTANSNFTAQVNGNYFIDNVSASRTVTLPANPQIGDTVRFLLLSNANPVFFNRNGNKYVGIDIDIRSQIPSSLIELIYVNPSFGWSHTLPSSQSANGFIRNWVSNGDSNGVFFLYGTNFGNQAWANPHTQGRLVLSSNTSTTNIAVSIDRSISNFWYTGQQISGHWWQVDLINHRLILNRYTHFRQSGSGEVPRRFRIQGSNDLTNWDTLLIVDNTNFGNWLNLSVSSNSAYRYFRLLLNNNGSFANNNTLLIDEIELYGTLIPI